MRVSYTYFITKKIIKDLKLYLSNTKINSNGKIRKACFKLTQNEKAKVSIKKHLFGKNQWKIKTFSITDKSN